MTDASNPVGPRPGKAPPLIMSATLMGFYSTRSPRLGNWLKALKKAQVSNFDAQDAAQALAELSVHDPVLKKTVLLAGARSAPTAVHRWVERAVAVLLEPYIGQIAPQTFLNDIRVETLLKAPTFELRSKKVLERQRASNLLRLVLGRQLEKRPDQLGDVMMTIDGVYAGKGKKQDRARQMTVRLSKANAAILRSLSATYAFAHAESESIRSEINRLTVERGTLERRIAELQTELANLRTTNFDLATGVHDLEATVARLKQESEQSQRVAQHNASDLRLRMKAFLSNRLAQLIDDAVDGAEIARSQPARAGDAVALTLERLRTIKTAMGREAAWLSSDSTSEPPIVSPP